MSYGLIDVAMDMITGNIKYASPELQQSRLDCCNHCPLLIKLMGQCSKCGCIVSYKVKFLGASCPNNIW